MARITSFNQPFRADKGPLRIPANRWIRQSEPGVFLCLFFICWLFQSPAWGSSRPSSNRDELGLRSYLKECEKALDGQDAFILPYKTPQRPLEIALHRMIYAPNGDFSAWLETKRDPQGRWQGPSRSLVGLIETGNPFLRFQEFEFSYASPYAPLSAVLLEFLHQDFDGTINFRLRWPEFLFSPWNRQESLTFQWKLAPESSSRPEEPTAPPAHLSLLHVLSLSRLYADYRDLFPELSAINPQFSNIVSTALIHSPSQKGGHPGASELWLFIENSFTRSHPSSLAIAFDMNERRITKVLRRPWELGPNQGNNRVIVETEALFSRSANTSDHLVILPRTTWPNEREDSPWVFLTPSEDGWQETSVRMEPDKEGEDRQQLAPMTMGEFLYQSLEKLPGYSVDRNLLTQLGIKAHVVPLPGLASTLVQISTYQAYEKDPERNPLLATFFFLIDRHLRAKFLGRILPGGLSAVSPHGETLFLAESNAPNGPSLRFVNLKTGSTTPIETLQTPPTIGNLTTAMWIDEDRVLITIPKATRELSSASVSVWLGTRQGPLDGNLTTPWPDSPEPTEPRFVWTNQNVATDPLVVDDGLSSDTIDPFSENGRSGFYAWIPEPSTETIDEGSPSLRFRLFYFRLNRPTSIVVTLDFLSSKRRREYLERYAAPPEVVFAYGVSGPDKHPSWTTAALSAEENKGPLLRRYSAHGLLPWRHRVRRSHNAFLRELIKPALSSPPENQLAAWGFGSGVIPANGPLRFLLEPPSRFAGQIRPLGLNSLFVENTGRAIAIYGAFETAVLLP